MAILDFKSARLTGACAIATPQDDAIARHQGIENALSMALHYYRTSGTPEGLQAAAKKAFRAAALLDQACAHQTAVGGAA